MSEKKKKRGKRGKKKRGKKKRGKKKRKKLPPFFTTKGLPKPLIIVLK